MSKDLLDTMNLLIRELSDLKNKVLDLEIENEQLKKINKELKDK